MQGAVKQADISYVFYCSDLRRSLEIPPVRRISQKFAGYIGVSTLNEVDPSRSECQEPGITAVIFSFYDIHAIAAHSAS